MTASERYLECHWPKVLIIGFPRYDHKEGRKGTIGCDACKQCDNSDFWELFFRSGDEAVVGVLIEIYWQSNSSIAEVVFKLLNSIPPTEERVVRLINDPNWNEIVETGHKFRSLYDLHLLGNLIREGNPDWISGFVKKWAGHFLQFAFCES
jgi:hypothetical protein